MALKAVYGQGEDSVFLPATTISGTTPISVDMFCLSDMDSIGLQLISTGTVAGAWTILVSNNAVPTANGSGSYGQMSGSTTAVWTDVTSGFSPTISAPAGSATNQYAQGNITARAVRITFTPTSGAGTVSVLGFAKSWS